MGGGMGQSGMNLGASTTTFQDCEDTDACSAFRISIFGTPQEPTCGLGPVDQACPKTCNACEEACNLCCTTNGSLGCQDGVDCRCSENEDNTGITDQSGDSQGEDEEKQCEDMGYEGMTCATALAMPTVNCEMVGWVCPVSCDMCENEDNTGITDQSGDSQGEDEEKQCEDIGYNGMTC